LFSFHSAKLQRITGKAGRWITDCITSITDIFLHVSHPTFSLQADQENQPPETQLDAHGNPYTFQT